MTIKWKQSLVTLILMALGILALTLWPPKVVAADMPAPQSLTVADEDWHRLEPRQYLFLKYPEVAAKIDRVIKCESGWKSDAHNKTSTATGLAQFLNGTWLSTRKKMGLSVDLESRLNPYEHIDAAVWLYEANGISPWLESQPCHHIYEKA